MIEFFFENDFVWEDTQIAQERVGHVLLSEKKSIGDINYIFCDDEYLLKINQQYLQHDDYTDIITFNYNENDRVSGDIYISTERVCENAQTLKVDFIEELYRVIYHGVLHLCDYNDKTEDEQKEMRKKEDYYLNLHS